MTPAGQTVRMDLCMIEKKARHALQNALSTTGSAFMIAISLHNAFAGTAAMDPNALAALNPDMNLGQHANLSLTWIRMKISTRGNGNK